MFDLKKVTFSYGFLKRVTRKGPNVFENGPWTNKFAHHCFKCVLESWFLYYFQTVDMTRHTTRSSGVNFTNIYSQLLREKIPKAQKRLRAWLYFWQNWDLRALKLCLNMLVKLTPGPWTTNTWVTFTSLASLGSRPTWDPGCRGKIFTSRLKDRQREISWQTLWKGKILYQIKLVEAGNIVYENIVKGNIVATGTL